MRQAWGRAHGGLDCVCGLLGELLALNDELDVFLLIATSFGVAPPDWSLVFALQTKVVASGAQRSALIALLSSQSAGVASYLRKRPLAKKVLKRKMSQFVSYIAPKKECRKKREIKTLQRASRSRVELFANDLHGSEAVQSEGESILPVLDLRCKCELASSSAEFFAFELFLTLAVLVTVFATAMFALMPNAAAYTLGDWVDIMYGRASFPGRGGLCVVGGACAE